MPSTASPDDGMLRPGASPVEELDVKALAAMVRNRRGSQSLRQTAEDVGVSFSTLTRIESGATPDLTSFTRVCAWLGVPPSQFFNPIAVRRRNSIEEFVAHLHEDPRLSEQAAESIAATLKQMYQALADAAEPKALVTCHLRAASTLRPGVPQRLASLLDDFNAALTNMEANGEL